MKHFCLCGNEIPEKRYTLGYRTCLGCSTEAKWSGIQVIYHKTGNTIQVVKDPEVAKDFFMKTSRSGFGAMKGMTSSYRQKPLISERERKPRTFQAQPQNKSYIVQRKKPDHTKYMDEKVAEGVLSRMEEGRREDAEKFLDLHFKQMLISPIAKKQLKYIIENWQC